MLCPDCRRPCEPTTVTIDDISYVGSHCCQAELPPLAETETMTSRRPSRSFACTVCHGDLSIDCIVCEPPMPADRCEQCGQWNARPGEMYCAGCLDWIEWKEELAEAEAVRA